MSGTLTAFTAGDLVISVYGDANNNGTYTLDQASPITLEEITTTGTAVGDMVLPQTTSVVNGTTEYQISGEYGSASEGALELSGDGQSLTILGYGVNAVTFDNAGSLASSPYGSAALGQSTSTAGGIYTPVPRVVADISYNGSIDTSTALYNIYNTNNPRSVATVNGSSFYLSGQSTKDSSTQGVFETTDGSSSSTAIDTSTDTREAEIVNGVLYVSRDSTQGAGGGTSNISSYGSTLPTSATAPIPLAGITGTITLTAAQENSVNASAVGTVVNLSPEAFYFADANTLYVADSGFPKAGGIGDGGLQKWTFNGTTWVLDYTLSAGLNLVSSVTATSGTTGLYDLTGTVVGDTVELYATTSTAGETDQSYLYGITDDLTATTLPTSETFTELMAAAPDSIIRGVAFAPSQSTVAPTNTTVVSGTPQSGLTVTSGSTLTVQSGGVLTSATILLGGTATVSGSDTASFVAHGGSETILGSASADQIDGIQLVSAATAVISGEVVNNGGTVELFLKGAVASATDVTTGGSLFISGNATAYNTILNGGTLELQSPKATLSGSLTFSGAAALEVTSLSSAGFGDQAVISSFGGGDVIDLTVIGSGATLSTALVSGNTVATVTSGGASQAFTFAGTFAPSLTLTSDTNGAAEIAYLAPAPTDMTVSGGSSEPNLSVTAGSTLTVDGGGTITTAIVSSGGTVTDGGIDIGSTILAGGFELVLGSATADQVYGLQLISGSTAAVSGETVFNGGSIDLFLKGGVVASSVVASGGQLNISGNATASNTVLSSGGLIDLQSPKANLTGALTFAGPATLEFTDVTSGGFDTGFVISGFELGDAIDETVIGTGATLTSGVVSGNTVETITSGSVSEPFTFAGTYAPGFFALEPDAMTGVQLIATESSPGTGAPCYCRGTNILTDRGDVAVEALRIGELLRTHAGALRPIRWIGRRSYAGRFAAGNRDVLPVVIRAGALGEGVPQRDLWVSPLHAMFLDGVLVPAAALVNGTSIVQAESVEQVEYFHVELERHDVILAEGAPSETFIDDHSRGMFHNAAEFFSMYPNAPREAARYCAPRVESGEALQAIRARLAGAAAGAPMGRLRGRLDEVSRASVAGWAADGSGKVQLVVTDNGVVIGQVSAENFRADLAAAGIGTGCHGFDLTIPGGLSPFVRHVIEIRRSADGAILDNSPWVLEAVAVPVAHSGPGSTVRGRLDTATRERITGWAQDEADITQPVALQILDNGIPLARVLANRHRPDLAAAGIGSGWHSFDVILPGGLSPLVRHVIEVRRESDGAPLPGSPMVIAPEKSFSAEMQRAIAQAVAAVGSEGEREHVLSFIAAQAEQLLQQQADAEAGRVARLAGLRQSRASIASQDAELRALVIDERVPQAGRDGGSAAILSHIKALQALGYAVSLVAADDMTADSPALAALGVRLCRAPFYATVEEVLRRQSGCFDVVYLHRASVAARYLTLARAHASRGRLIYSIADLHHIRLERQAAVEDRPELFAQSRRLRLEEYRAAWAADAVITHSGDEAEWLRQAVPSANIHVVGWDFAPRRQPAPFASRHGVAFIGNYAHAPNLDAAHFLAEEVMPLVRQVEPEMTCLLVGDGAAQQVGHLAGGGIEVTGHVADLQDIFDRVRLTVAPLRFGAGLKGKVLESFAAGLPCVLTPIAAEGFSLAAAASDHISADAAGLAASICLLHRSQAMHDAAVQAGLALVETQYSAAAIQDGLRNAIAGSATGRGADKLLHHPPSFHAKINAR